MLQTAELTSLAIPSAPAINPSFDEEALRKLIVDLQRDLDATTGSRADFDDDLLTYRNYYALAKRTFTEGFPNHTVPYVRGKIAGAAAQFREALDQDPFFVTLPYTAEASRNQAVWETLMERELDHGRVQKQLFAGVEEACVTGTGVLGLEVVKPFDEFIIGAKAHRLENFYAAPSGVENLSQASTFVRFLLPQYVLREKAESGEYDADAVSIVIQDKDFTPNYEQRKDGTRTTAYADDNAPHELWECYYRYGGDLWRIIYSKQQSRILRIEPNPYNEAFDAPPYVPLRVMPRVDYFYGTSYAQALASSQDIMDFAFNSRLAYDQLAVTPPVFVDEDSPAYTQLKNGIRAGLVIPTRGNPNDSVLTLNLPHTTESLTLLNLARTLGDDATFTDLALNGRPIGTVRSATEINAVMSGATKKLSQHLSNLTQDLRVFAEMFWSLIYTYKIKPAGVLPVFSNSAQYLIAAKAIPSGELLSRVQEFQQLSGLPLTQDLGSANVFIASGKRDDMEWIPNGASLVPDKVLRANKLERLMASMLPALQIARVDSAAWHIMKSYLESLDFHNWRDYLPPKPPEAQASPEQMAQFAQQMQQVRQGGGSA